MRAIGKLGKTVWVQCDELRHAAAVVGTVLLICVQSRRWVRTVRTAFDRAAACFQEAQRYRAMALALRRA